MRRRSSALALGTLLTLLPTLSAKPATPDAGTGTPAAEAPTAAPAGAPATRSNAEADRRYYEAWGISPDDPALQSAWGNELFEIGDLAGARAAFDAALAADPDSPAAHYGYGELLLSRHQLEPALEQFLAVVAAGSSPFEAAAHTRAGRILGQLDRADEALAHFQRAVELNPDQAEAQFNLGLSLKRHGREPDALAHLERAVALDPQLFRAERLLARVLVDVGRPQEGVAHYESLLARDRADPTLLRDLSAAYDAAGDVARARATYARALELARRYPRYRDIAERLERERPAYAAPEAHGR